MKHRLAVLAFTIALLAAQSGLRGASPQDATAPTTAPLSEAVLARLPIEWREPAGTLLRVNATDGKRYLTITPEALRTAIATRLARNASADAFVKAQLTRDPSPRVRAAIVQVIGADARWLKYPDTVALLESVVTGDPEASVSLAALEMLRRGRVRSLNVLFNSRLAEAKKAANAPAIAVLTAEQERWINFERGTMLPAFLETPPPPFAVKPADAAVRVLAFGDFGTGSAEQKATAQAIVAYHREHRFDLALTLGDNFYELGMESPSDARWQTQFEQLYGPLRVTFYPAFGNHDWGFSDSPAAEILYSGKTRRWKMPAAYYTFTAGAVQFFALDTQTVALSDKQLQWLDRELMASRAQWKVVYGHHPIYSGGNYEDRPDLIARLLPILKNRADVYICGHDHNLQALQPDEGVHFYVAGGGGANLYELRAYARSIFASSANGFAVIEADQTQLAVKLVGTNGVALYTDTLRKDRP